MPREIVKPQSISRGIPAEEWAKRFFVPTNYRSQRTAVFHHTGRKTNEDPVHKLHSIEDNYVQTMVDTFKGTTDKLGATVCLLEPPIEYTNEARTVKMDDDALYFNEQHTGVLGAWDVTLDADYSRMQCCIFDATTSKNSRQVHENIEVALSVLHVHKYFYERTEELKRLTKIVYDMPRMRDTMQKYIACIVMEKDFDTTQLETMFNTVVQRNQKFGRNLPSLYGLLVLCPLIKQHYTTDCDPWTVAPILHKAYKNIIATIPTHDYDRAVVQLGRVFGCVAKSQVRKSIYTMRTHTHIQNVPNYNDTCTWIEATPSTTDRRRSMTTPTEWWV